MQIKHRQTVFLKTDTREHAQEFPSHWDESQYLGSPSSHSIERKFLLLGPDTKKSCTDAHVLLRTRELMMRSQCSHPQP